jgi:hypothetical protein
MNKKRLLELAGISSNMSNPSQEPYTEIPSSSDEVPAMSNTGDDSFSDDNFDEEDALLRRTIENVIPQIKTLAMQGMSMNDIEEAKVAFNNILELLGQESGEY